MSSDTLSGLLEAHPNEKQAVSRLMDLISSIREEGGKELSFDLIFDRVEPKSHHALAEIVSELVEAGLLKERVKVMSRGMSGGVIEVFGSIYDLPDTITDDLSHGELMRITPQDLRLVYQISD